MVVKSILGMAGKALAKKYLSKNKNIKGLSRASNLSGMPNVISRYPMIGKLNKKKKNQ